MSWTGCPAEVACIHYLDESPRRVTACCKACSKALVKIERRKARGGGKA